MICPREPPHPPPAGGTYKLTGITGKNIYIASELQKTAAALRGAGYCYEDTNGAVVDGSNKTEIAETVTVSKTHIDANNDGYCDDCGIIIDGIAAVKSVDLLLDGNIGVNFYMELGAEVPEDENAYVEFTENGKTTQVPVKDGVQNTTEKPGTDLYVFTCTVSAKEMTDTITAQVHTGDKTGKQFTYSVKQYADKLLGLAPTSENTDYTAAVPLVKAMLNYGAYAQLHFGHNTEALANASLDETEKDVSAVTADTLASHYTNDVSQSSSDFIKATGITLELRSETSLWFTFELLGDTTTEQLTLTSGGKALTMAGNEVAIENISASNLDTKYAITVKKDGADDYTVSYSPLAYAYQVLNAATGSHITENLKNTVRALYLYNQAADAYNSRT